MNDFMALGIGSDAIAHMIESPVFTTHAKGGGDIGERLETEAKAADSQIVEEEIAMVAQWIGQISQQAGVSGLRNPLL
jgi:C4-dicarboxylate-specific signal transduction histidine kinase